MNIFLRVYKGLTNFYPLEVIKYGVYKDRTRIEKSLNEHEMAQSVSSSSTADLPDNFSLLTDSSVFSKKVSSYKKRLTPLTLCSPMGGELLFYKYFIHLINKSTARKSITDRNRSNKN